MTAQERDNILLSLQCRHSKYAEELITAFNAGTRGVKCKSQNNTAAGLLKNVIYRFSGITYAVRIDITILGIPGVNTTNLLIDGNLVAAASGDGLTITAADAVSQFVDDINNQVYSSKFFAINEGDSLIVYSVDTSVNFSTPTVLIPVFPGISGNISYIPQETDSIQYPGNCLTAQQVRQVDELAKYFLTCNC